MTWPHVTRNSIWHDTTWSDRRLKLFVFDVLSLFFLNIFFLVVKECCGSVLERTVYHSDNNSNSNNNNNSDNIKDGDRVEWRVVCYPFYHFFNWNEDEFSEEKYVPQIDWNTAKVSKHSHHASVIFPCLPFPSARSSLMLSLSFFLNQTFFMLCYKGLWEALWCVCVYVLVRRRVAAVFSLR